MLGAAFSASKVRLYRGGSVAARQLRSARRLLGGSLSCDGRRERPAPGTLTGDFRRGRFVIAHLNWSDPDEASAGLGVTSSQSLPCRYLLLGVDDTHATNRIAAPATGRILAQPKRPGSRPRDRVGVSHGDATIGLFSARPARTARAHRSRAAVDARAAPSPGGAATPWLSNPPRQRLPAALQMPSSCIGYPMRSAAPSRWDFMPYRERPLTST